MPTLDPNIPELDALIEECEHKAQHQPEIDAILLKYYVKLARVRKAKTLRAYIAEQLDIDYSEYRLRADVERLKLAGRQN